MGRLFEVFPFLRGLLGVCILLVLGFFFCDCYVLFTGLFICQGDLFIPLAARSTLGLE